ncbi:MAG: hypothetical protein WAW88_14640 [Nocardioides sp.]
MSRAPVDEARLTGPTTTPRRVRDDARERLAVMAFSAVVSVTISASLLVLSGLAR